MEGKTNHMFKLDRKAFSAGSYEELTAQNKEYWKTKSLEERPRAAACLNSVAWNYPLNRPPGMDKTVFSAREQK